MVVRDVGNKEPGDIGKWLLMLQDCDSEVERLEYSKTTLPERVALIGIRERMQDLAAKTADFRVRKDAITAKQSDLQMEVNTVVARKKVFDRKMHSGELLSSREIEAMNREIDNLGIRAEELQDKQFGLMLDLEGLEQELDELQAEVDQLSTRSDQLFKIADSKLNSLDAEVQSALKRRTGIEQNIPSDIISRYDTIRKRAGGVGAARLQDGKCSGCHLAVTPVSVVSTRVAGSVAVCENCGRFIIEDTWN
jgi:predicted  nucleic acid-binding Zn-ribbon protein